eukprot:9873067-Alexandrium_andersonii.AAC.1
MQHALLVTLVGLCSLAALLAAFPSRAARTPAPLHLARVSSTPRSRPPSTTLIWAPASAF